MDFTKFQNKLNKAWEEILDKKEIDENYEKGAQVKAHDIYWFTLNKNNLPGVIIKENNQIHVLNAPSPGATASLSIAKYIIKNYI